MTSFSKTVAGPQQTLAITLAWQHEGGAQSFAVEVGRAAGAADVHTATVAGMARTYVWHPPPTGNFVARVRATNEAGASVSPDVTITVANIRDLTEALYLGSGPLASPDGGCFFGGMMNGWEPGRQIRLVAAASLSSGQRQAVDVVADNFRSVSMGANPIVVASSTEQEPTPRDGEITIAEMETPACAAGQSACARAVSTSPQRLVRSASVQLRRSASRGFEGGIYHELGHALFGLCHIDGRSPLVSIGMSAMLGAGRLTDFELGIARSVYAAGLRPGANRSRFASAGLVMP